MELVEFRWKRTCNYFFYHSLYDTVMRWCKRGRTRLPSIICSSVDRQFSPSKQTDNIQVDTSSQEDSESGDTDETHGLSPSAKRPRTCVTSTAAENQGQNLNNTPGKCSCTLPSTILIFFLQHWLKSPQRSSHTWSLSFRQTRWKKYNQNELPSRTPFNWIQASLGTRCKHNCFQISTTLSNHDHWTSLNLTSPSPYLALFPSPGCHLKQRLHTQFYCDMSVKQRNHLLSASASVKKVLLDNRRIRTMQTTAKAKRSLTTLPRSQET